MAATNAYLIKKKTLNDIEQERKYQVRAKGYTREFDDNDNMPHDWVTYLDEYVLRVDSALTPAAYRKSLVKVAALAVAAIESYDRQDVE